MRDVPQPRAIQTLAPSSRETASRRVRGGVPRQAGVCEAENAEPGGLGPATERAIELADVYSAWRWHALGFLGFLRDYEVRPCSGRPPTDAKFL